MRHGVRVAQDATPLSVGGLDPFLHPRQRRLETVSRGLEVFELGERERKLGLRDQLVDSQG